MGGWTETEEIHRLSADMDSTAKSSIVKVRVAVNGEKKMVIDKATKAWFQYGPEEFVRQFWEQVLHDDYGYSWRRIRPEAPLKIGSRECRADLVVLRNPERPVEPTNYLLIVEVKKRDANLEGARMQLQSYMGASDAIEGFVSDGLRQQAFVKSMRGKLLPVSELDKHKRKEDLLFGPDIRQLHVNNRMFRLYCDGMEKLLSKIPQDSRYNKDFVAFWRNQAQVIREHGRVDPC